MKLLLAVFAATTVLTVVAAQEAANGTTPSDPAADAAADAKLLQNLQSMPKVSNEVAVDLIKFDKLQKGTFIEALAACKSEGMDLADARTESKSNDVYIKILKENLLENGESLWLAATDAYIEGQWLWLGTGDPLVFKDFRKGEPNNTKNDEHCLVIWKTAGEIGWNDAPCTNKYKIVCQKKKPDPSTIGQPDVHH